MKPCFKSSAAFGVLLTAGALSWRLLAGTPTPEDPPPPGTPGHESKEEKADPPTEPPKSPVKPRPVHDPIKTHHLKSREEERVERRDRQRARMESDRHTARESARSAPSSSSSSSMSTGGPGHGSGGGGGEPDKVVEFDFEGKRIRFTFGDIIQLPAPYYTLPVLVEHILDRHGDGTHTSDSAGKFRKLYSSEREMLRLLQDRLAYPPRFRPSTKGSDEFQKVFAHQVGFAHRPSGGGPSSETVNFMMVRSRHLDIGHGFTKLVYTAYPIF